jgi:cytochrome oxidase assembly protein ShyY1
LNTVVAELSLPRTLLRGRYVRLIALCVLGAVLCALAGRWQYHRWQYKREANGELRSSASAGTVPVGQLLAMDRPLPAADTYRTVTASGSWDRGGELYVRARQVNDQLAYLVITPLRLTDGHTLLVVRGWQAATGSATQRPAAPAAQPGQVSVTARVYPSEPGDLGAGLPDRQIDRIDTAEIGTRIGTPVYDGYAELITQQPPDGALPPLPPPDLSNPAGGADQWQHFAYVVQWYCFALLALAAPFLLAVLERRERRPARDREDPRDPRDPRDLEQVG